MELEIVRMSAAAAAHVAFGINAKLPGVPRDAGDAPPPNVTVYNSTKHGWVTRSDISRRSTGAVWPAVAVSLLKPGSLEGEIQTTYRDGEFDVVWEYMAADDESELACEAGLYTMRAALRTLAAFHHPDNSALRTRNGIALMFCKGIKPAPIFAIRGDVVVTAALIITYKVRDTQPS